MKHQPVHELKITRVWAMPSPDTFSIPPIGELIRRWIEGRECKVVVDPFARNSTLAALTNDLNPDTDAQFHMDAAEWLEGLDGPVDMVLLDPPYSPRQISECYKEVGRKVGMADTQNAKLYKAVKDAADKLVRLYGVVVCCGWNSSGMGITRGYLLHEILLVAHGGAHNDTIVTVETKVRQCRSNE